MNPIKGVLAEELKSSKRMLDQYQAALRALPKGSLVPKKIKGRQFYYMARREGERIKFDYRGKLSQEQLSKLKESIAMRAKYRRLMADLKRQIIFINRALHERKRRPS